MAKFREFSTSSGKLVLAGKDAKNNEELIEQIEEDEDVLHTSKPGSPFVNIKSKTTNIKDKKESALFCASKSQAWLDNKSDFEVHLFKGKDIYKEKRMKLGTFGVKKFKIINLKKKDIEEFIKRNKD